MNVGNSEIAGSVPVRVGDRDRVRAGSPGVARASLERGCKRAVALAEQDREPVRIAAGADDEISLTILVEIADRNRLGLLADSTPEPTPPPVTKFFASANVPSPLLSRTATLRCVATTTSGLPSLLRSPAAIAFEQQSPDG